MNNGGKNKKDVKNATQPPSFAFLSHRELSDLHTLSKLGITAFGECIFRTEIA
jgi:hypothetical protein